MEVNANPSAVWIASSSSYGEQQGVEAVFSTREAAQAFADEHSRPGNAVYVQHWRVDAVLHGERGPYPGLVRAEAIKR